jgi:hypothetical protein
LQFLDKKLHSGAGIGAILLFMSRHSAKAAGRSSKTARKTSKKAVKSARTTVKKASKTARRTAGKASRSTASTGLRAKTASAKVASASTKPSKPIASGVSIAPSAPVRPAPLPPVQPRPVIPAPRGHKYQVGETVYYTSPTFGRTSASVIYTVVKLLPSESDDYQYRIKSSGETFERVAKESQLEKV